MGKADNPINHAKHNEECIEYYEGVVVIATYPLFLLLLVRGNLVPLWSPGQFFDHPGGNCNKNRSSGKTDYQ